MFKEFTERDFIGFREHLKSRQNPNSLGGALFISCFLQFLLYYLIYYVAAEATVYPNVATIKKIHFGVTLILTVFSAVFMFSLVFKTFEKTQYLLSILVSQNVFGIYSYLGALFLIGEGDVATSAFLVTFTYITSGIAVVLFVATFFRLYLLIKKGQYRESSKKGEEFESTSYIPIVIIASIGTLIILITLVINNGVIGVSDETIFFIVLSLLIFYVMIYVLPEQLIILYCKFRFKSFNFNMSGHLYPVGESDYESYGSRKN